MQIMWQIEGEGHHSRVKIRNAQNVKQVGQDPEVRINVLWVEWAAHCVTRQHRKAWRVTLRNYLISQLLGYKTFSRHLSIADTFSGLISGFVLKLHNQGRTVQTVLNFFFYNFAYNWLSWRNFGTVQTCSQWEPRSGENTRMYIRYTTTQTQSRS